MMLDLETPCLLCGAKASLKMENCPGYQEPQTFQIYSCPTCQTSFSLPRVDATPIYDSIYLNGRRVPGYDRYWKYVRLALKSKNPLNALAETEETYWAVRTSLSTFIRDKKKAKIVEIGSGLGYLTHSLYRDGYDVLGIDISMAAVNQATKVFGDHYLCADLFDYVEENEAVFDAVIMTEVLEHIERPQSFLSTIKRLLKKDGVAIITTPNKSFYPTDIAWGTELPPIHCWWFSETAMTYMAKQEGMTLSFLSFTDFYQRHPLVVRTDVLRNGRLHRPKLGVDGNLLWELRKRQNNPFIKFRTALYSNNCIKSLYNSLMAKTKTSGLVCGDKGLVICAMFVK